MPKSVTKSVVCITRSHWIFQYLQHYRSLQSNIYYWRCVISNYLMQESDQCLIKRFFCFKHKGIKHVLNTFQTLHVVLLKLLIIVFIVWTAARRADFFSNFTALPSLPGQKNTISTFPSLFCLKKKYNFCRPLSRGFKTGLRKAFFLDVNSAE